LEQPARILDPQDCTLIGVDFLQESRARWRTFDCVEKWIPDLCGLSYLGPGFHVTARKLST